MKYGMRKSDKRRKKFKKKKCVWKMQPDNKWHSVSDHVIISRLKIQLENA